MRTLKDLIDPIICWFFIMVTTYVFWALLLLAVAEDAATAGLHAARCAGAGLVVQD